MAQLYIGGSREHRMGKNYDEKLRKIAVFEQEMIEFAKQHDRTFGMATRVRKDILRASAGRPIDEVLNEIRDGIKEVILRPESGQLRLPKQMPPPEDPTIH